MEKNNPLSELMRTTLESVPGHGGRQCHYWNGHRDGWCDPDSGFPPFLRGCGRRNGVFHQEAADGGRQRLRRRQRSQCKLEPVAFLVIRDGGVKLLPVAPPPATTVDRVIDTVPEVVDKVTDFIAKQQEKKEEQAAQGEFAD